MAQALPPPLTFVLLPEAVHDAVASLLSLGGVCRVTETCTALLALYSARVTRVVLRQSKPLLPSSPLPTAAAAAAGEAKGEEVGERGCVSVAPTVPPPLGRWTRLQKVEVNDEPATTALLDALEAAQCACIKSLTIGGGVTRLQASFHAAMQGLPSYQHPQSQVHVGETHAATATDVLTRLATCMRTQLLPHLEALSLSSGVVGQDLAPVWDVLGASACPRLRKLDVALLGGLPPGVGDDSRGPSVGLQQLATALCARARDGGCAPLTSLNIEGPKLAGDAFTQLMRQGLTAAVENLGLSSLTREALQAVGEFMTSTGAPNLKHLKLHGIYTTQAEPGLGAVASAMENGAAPSLQAFEVDGLDWDRGVTRSVVRAVGTGHWKCLQTLQMRAVPIPQADLDALLMAMAMDDNCPQVRELEFSMLEAASPAWSLGVALGDTPLAFPLLQELSFVYDDLSGVDGGSAVLERLLEGLQSHARLRRLSLESCSLGPSEMRLLSRFFVDFNLCPNLEKLDLSTPDSDAQEGNGGYMLNESITGMVDINESVTGMVHLAFAVERGACLKALKELQMDYVHVTNGDATAFARAFRRGGCPRLERITMHGDRLTEDAKAAVRDSLAGRPKPVDIEFTSHMRCHDSFRPAVHAQGYVPCLRRRGGGYRASASKHTMMSI